MAETYNSMEFIKDRRKYTYDNMEVTVTYLNEPSRKAIEDFNKGINKIIHKFL